MSLYDVPFLSVPRGALRDEDRWEPVTAFGPENKISLDQHTGMNFSRSPLSPHE